MKLLRWILGKIILALNALFAPKPVLREPSQQQKIQASLRKMSLYQYEACPFCVKVRRFMRREAIELPLKNALKEPFRGELLSGGGKLQVPCLKIENDDGTTQWMYESNDITAFLEGKIAQASRS